MNGPMSEPIRPMQESESSACGRGIGSDMLGRVCVENRPHAKHEELHAQAEGNELALIVAVRCSAAVQIRHAGATQQHQDTDRFPPPGLHQPGGSEETWHTRERYQDGVENRFRHWIARLLEQCAEPGSKSVV